MDDVLLSSSSPRLFVYIPENVLYVGTSAFQTDIAVYYAGSECSYSNNLLYKNVRHTADGYYYVENESGISIINYDGSNSRIIIPETINDKPVTSIADYAFYTNPYIERVEIPKSVTSIGKYTFFVCKYLHSLFVPDSVESFGIWDDDVYELIECGFEATTVFFEATTFDFPGGITSPEQLEIIKYMTGVKPADVTDDDACVYIKRATSYEVVTIKNKLGAVVIPATVDGIPVSRINTYALFLNENVTTVWISDGISKISTLAFYDCDGLAAVRIPASVEAVNYRAFYYVDSCTIYIDSEQIPPDWDSNWYYSISGYKTNYNVYFDSTGSYVYEIVDGNVYLIKYMYPIYSQTPVFIPDSVDGLTVYGVRAYCYDTLYSTGSSNKYIFVVPSSITVMEQYAIYLYYYSGNCYVYTDFVSSAAMPSTWHSKWCYSTYYSYYYPTYYYNNQWELVDGIPVLK